MHIGKCELCGKTTEYKYKSWVKKFCSHKCSNAKKWENRKKGDTIEIECEHCKKKFSLLKSVARVREKFSGKIRFCSKLCMGIGFRKLETFTVCKCDNCNIEFSKRTDHLTKKNYCSCECSSKGRIKYGAWSTHLPDTDKKRQYHRDYYDKNRERLNLLSQKWAKRNRAYRNYIQNIRRSAGTLTFKEYQEIINEEKCCKFCGATSRLSIDHIIPIIKGGKTERDNLQVLCIFCNSSKGNRDSPLNRPSKAQAYEICA